MSTADNVDDLAPALLIVYSTFLFLSTVAIIIRFWSRTVGFGERKYWWDDWTALLAWSLIVALSVVGFVWSHHGLGKHFSSIPTSEHASSFKNLLVSYTLFLSIVACIKSSALLFYARVFSPARGFRIALIIVHALVAVWFICFFCISIFSCHPIRKFWLAAQAPGKCIDLWGVDVASAVIDVMLDLVVLLLPMPVIWSLNCRRTRKLSLALAFFCGYLAIIPSIGRLVDIVQEGDDLTVDETYVTVPDQIWAFTEASVGLVSVCIPSWIHLWRRATERGLASLFHLREESGRSAQRRYTRHSEAGFDRL